MKKKLLFVSSVPPFQLYGGGSHTAEILLESFKKKFDVKLLFWENVNVNIKTNFYRNKLKGFDYFQLINENKVYNKFFKIFSIFYSKKKYNPYGFEIDDKIKEYIKKNSIDYIFLFDYKSLFAFRNLNFKNKISFPLDPVFDHKMWAEVQNRRLINKIIYYFFLTIHYYKLKNVHDYLVNKCRYIITFTDSDIQKYKNNFRSNFLHLNLPHKDLRINLKVKKREDDKIQIVHVGSFDNKMTPASLLWIGEKIVPLILKSNLKNKFEFILIGKKLPDENIKNLFSKVRVNYIKFLSEKEYYSIIKSSDAFVYAYPISIGSRMNRILGALSVPAAIVCTNSILESHNNLKNNFNVLSSNNPDQFLKNIIKLKKNKKFSSKIKKNARQCYEKNFQIKVFQKKISFFLKKL